MQSTAKRLSSKSKTITRTALSTSRLLDFFSRKELVAQVGHDVHDWPLVVVKELVDNALDACEEARVAPEITVTVDGNGITVADNGPGLPAESINEICDFEVRLSSREAYIAPDRGAQGNALKTLIAMPFVLTGGDEGRVEVTARGRRHVITIAADRIAGRPDIRIEAEEVAESPGTSVTIAWPGADSACGIDPDDDHRFLQVGGGGDQLDTDSACGILVSAKSRFLQIVSDYAILNPHASIVVSWFGDRTEHAATDPAWRKWAPSNPTSVHWYQPEHFERLIAGYIAHDRDHGADRTVREFVAEFDGLTSTIKQKAVLAATGLARAPLSSLAADRDLNRQLVDQLRVAMVGATTPVKPRRLGPLGKKSIEAKFTSMGAEMAQSFAYKKLEGETDGLPWIVETAFAWFPKKQPRRLVTGVNWSPGIVNPFRQLGRYGHSLDTVLATQRASREESVVLLLHMCCPRVEYTDRGKSAVVTKG